MSLSSGSFIRGIAKKIPSKRFIQSICSGRSGRTRKTPRKDMKNDDSIMRA